jgi:hypothetical protein
MSGYAGAGQAVLIRETEQKTFFANEALAVGELSAAFELSRITSMYYPWGFSVEIGFTGAPGTFEIDVMGADTDASTNYVKLGSITAVNTSNVGRFDALTYWPRYVALSVATFPNAATVKVTAAKLTR